MAPDPEWGVGNGNDRYGPGPLVPPASIFPGATVGLPTSRDGQGETVPLYPQFRPEHAIYEDQGHINDLNKDSNPWKSRRQGKKAVQLAYITTFEDGYEGIIHANEDPAKGQAPKWHEAATSLETAAEALNN